ncbi:MAG: helix-turn-helix domain-containing protein, partial [Prevotellaceae bacterium]|nr:helix-turn-helix domain-containing protein [Prevotellaceae bacterium]
MGTLNYNFFTPALELNLLYVNLLRFEISAAVAFACFKLPFQRTKFEKSDKQKTIFFSEKRKRKITILIVRCTKIYNKVILHFQISVMNIKEKIGKRLRELRTIKGLSQEKFSFECELDRTYIASIEQGRRNVSIVNI